MSDEVLEIGNRVRVLASKGELEGGRKGTVVAVHPDGNTEVRMDGNLDDYLVESANLEKIIPIQPAPQPEEPVYASTGAMEMTRALYGVKFVNSGTPEELLEVEGHLQKMIDEGMTPLFMMRYLMNWRYQPGIIRRAFKNLTGRTIEDAVNEGYVRSPGCIPQFTMAWGKAKKNDGWFFVMPMVNYYGLFHQANDMERNEAGRHVELMDAMEAMKNLVTKVERWNPPVKDIKRKDVDPSQLYRQPQLFMSASAQSVADTLKGIHSPEAKSAIIKRAFRENLISKQDMEALLGVFADAEEKAGQEAVIDKLKELEDQEMKRPLEDDLAEKTPNDFFQREELEGRYTAIPADVVNAMSQYIEQVNAKLRDFSVALRTFKYTTLHPSGRKPVESDEPDLTNAIVSIAVVLDIADRSAPGNVKKGGIVFSVIGNKIWTTDTIKGLDRTIYGLSDEGLAKYFQKENSSRG
jgi:hypothetical protein